MIIELVHANGQRYRFPVSQVVIRDDGNRALALAYESAGMIVHAQATNSDWPEIVKDLGIGDAQPAELVRL